MSYTNETTHYHIPKPLGTDLTTPMDYNDAADAIDTAVWGAVQDAARATSDASDAKTTANGAAGDVAELSGTVTELSGTVGAQGDAITGLTNEVGDVRTDLSDAICAIKEASATASYAHAVGSFFWYNDTLYRTTQAITIGATIVPNTNCVTTNVTTELFALAPKGSVSVTSDGVKTIGALLNELFALIDFSKVTSRSTFTVRNASGANAVHNLVRSSDGNIRYSRISGLDANGLVIYFYELQANASVCYSGALTATTYSRTDASSAVEQAGSTYIIEY